MNEPKFTKGPWKAHGTQDVDWVETEWKGHNGPANETRETTEYICKCGKSNGFHNSFLIAAAPEMYAMLEELYDKLNRGMKYIISRRVKNGCSIDLARKCSASNIELARRIKALLKKARGEK